MTLMACYGLPPCEPLADGGSGVPAGSRCYIEPPNDGGTETDGGTTSCADGGAPVDGGC